MDIRMPVMDGYEATRQIKNNKKGKETIIIALTASVFEDEREVILAAGCDDFLRKPFCATELLNKMGQHLKLRYVYEHNETEELENIVRQKKLSNALTPDIVSILPIDFLAEVQEAAELADSQSLKQLLGEITEEYSEIVTTLNNWLDRFRVDKIADLMEEAIKTKKKTQEK